MKDPSRLRLENKISLSKCLSELKKKKHNNINILWSG
ncbi:MAG: hypothetical protein ACJA1Z_002807 [Patiriisocius sp.]|jgi:hypothetical protein